MLLKSPDQACAQLPPPPNPPPHPKHRHHHRKDFLAPPVRLFQTSPTSGSLLDWKMLVTRATAAEVVNTSSRETTACARNKSGRAWKGRQEQRRTADRLTVHARRDSGNFQIHQATAQLTPPRRGARFSVPCRHSWRHLQLKPAQRLLLLGNQPVETNPSCGQKNKSTPIAVLASKNPENKKIPNKPKTNLTNVETTSYSSEKNPRNRANNPQWGTPGLPSDDTAHAGKKLDRALEFRPAAPQ